MAAWCCACGWDIYTRSSRYRGPECITTNSSKPYVPPASYEEKDRDVLPASYVKHGALRRLIVYLRSWWRSLFMRFGADIPFARMTPVLSIDFRNRVFQAACIVIGQDAVEENCWISELSSISTRHVPLPRYPRFLLSKPYKLGLLSKPLVSETYPLMRSSG